MKGGMQEPRARALLNTEPDYRTKGRNRRQGQIEVKEFSVAAAQVLTVS